MAFLCCLLEFVLLSLRMRHQFFGNTNLVGIPPTAAGHPPAVRLGITYRPPPNGLCRFRPVVNRLLRRLKYDRRK